MNRIHVLLVLCLLYFSNCDTQRNEYADWGSLMDAPEIQKDWFPPLFKVKDNLIFQNNIFNIVIINDLDTNNVWGRFIHINNIHKYNEIISINPYTNSSLMNNRDKGRMNKIGFDENKIKLYFTEIQEDKIWHYFINTDAGVIYFCNFDI
jgi:hypothetical protein